MYFLAEQMGASVHMMESHYGHVNTIKHADRVLQGMAGWKLPQPDGVLHLARDSHGELEPVKAPIRGALRSLVKGWR